MNMKNYKIKSFLLVAVAILTLTGCADFLEIEPKTFVSEDNFWNEKTDIDQMVIGTYVKMQQDAFIRRCIMWGETRSDNIGEGVDCAAQTDIYRTLREYLQSTNSYSSWLCFYSVINQCNTIIERAPEVSQKDPVYTESDVKATQAEMAFIRDLCYFYLVRAFKDVPYYTYAIQRDADAKPIGVTDGDEIVRALIADLESCVGDALKFFPKDKEAEFNSSCNRATQNAIYSLLADLCLWDGQYDKCVTYAQRVIDAKMDEYKEKYSTSTSTTSGNVMLFKWDEDEGEGYPLYPCYSGNYFGNDYNQIFGSYGNSFESIFELAFTYDGSDNRYVQNTAVGALYGNHYTTKGNAGKGFLCSYEEVVTDPGATATNASNSQSKVFDHRYDCRYYTNQTIDNESSSTSSYVSKFVTSNISVGESSGSSSLPFSQQLAVYSIYDRSNWIFYRLTDVMLLQAEALIERAANDQYATTDLISGTKYDADLKKAFGLIYAVNRRSIMVASNVNSGDAATYDLKIAQYNDRANLRTLCMKERRRELMFEGKRWFDMLRVCHREGKVDYIKNNVPSKSGGSTPVNYEALFWPYNKHEIKTNPLLKQKSYYGEDDTEGNFTSTK